MRIAVHILLVVYILENTPAPGGNISLHYFEEKYEMRRRKRWKML
jgi:hypothetical protein